MSLITKNPGMKLLALAIAAALWIVVSGEEESVRTYSVPLDFTALSRDGILSGDTPGSVQVRIRGSDSVLRSLAADDLRVPVDVSKLRPGDRTVQVLGADSVQGIPSGVAVESVAPESVRLLVERRVQRSVRLRPRLEGAPAKGFVLTGVDLDPDHMVFDGPDSELGGLSMAPTEPILLEGRNQTFVAITGVPVPSQRIRLQETRPVKVTVHIAKENTR